MKSQFNILKILYYIIIITLSTGALGQSSSEVELENIVPNPGFERYSATPIGWFYKGMHFTNVMKYWKSPTLASPDIFGPRIRVPENWSEKGFGAFKAHSGSSWVGLTLYGCKDGKPHCREYIQIQLKEPLVIGQKYYIEFWTAHLPKSLQINNLGAFFSETEIDEPVDIALDIIPQVNENKIVRNNGKNWTKFSSYFIAEQEAEFLIIGNFYSDELTSAIGKSDSHPYAYYYIDDVLLRKEEPIIEVPIKDDDLTKVKLEKGKIIQLKNIHFDYDKWELLPRSFVELNKLLNIMYENPGLSIEIIGHTDSQGSHEYNINLSINRAKAVAEYLSQQGISGERTSWSGKGKQHPIANNSTGKGRQLNRRVEIKILKI